MADRAQLVKFAYATGLVKEAANPMAALETVAKNYTTAAKGLGQDAKSGVKGFFNALTGAEVGTAKTGLETAQAALKSGEEAGLRGAARTSRLNKLQQGVAEAEKQLGTAEEATRKARLGAGLGAGAIGAGLVGLKMYRNAATKAMNRKLMMGAGAAGLGGLALGSAMD
jgi:hypothetical protein